MNRVKRTEWGFCVRVLVGVVQVKASFCFVFFFLFSLFFSAIYFFSGCVWRVKL